MSNRGRRKFRSRAEAWTLKAARRLIAAGCAPLPEAQRDERYREWSAELPAILEHQRRFWPTGLLAVLCFAADHLRGTLPDRRPRRKPATVDAVKRPRGHSLVRRVAVVNDGVVAVVAVAAVAAAVVAAAADGVVNVAVAVVAVVVAVVAVGSVAVVAIVVAAVVVDVVMTRRR